MRCGYERLRVMCCRTTIKPLDKELARAILTTGRFKPVYFSPDQPGIAVRWHREVPEEGAIVTAHVLHDALELSISPAISAWEHHAMKRRAAGIYFEIAAKYAEKVNGTIEQRATVQGCQSGAVGGVLLLAQYPELPMRFDRVCAGFQAAFYAELGVS